MLITEMRYNKQAVIGSDDQAAYESNRQAKLMCETITKLIS